MTKWLHIIYELINYFPSLASTEVSTVASLTRQAAAWAPCTLQQIYVQCTLLV